MAAAPTSFPNMKVTHNQETNGAGKDVKKEVPLYIAGENVKCYNHCEKFGSSSKSCT